MSMIPIWQTGGPSAAQLPPGAKFAPTDGELLGYYLYNHIRGTLPPDHYSVISHQDLYGDDEPWEIWRRLQSGDDPGDVYVFTDLKRKVKSCGGASKRCARKVGRSGGNWHGEDTGTKFGLVRRARSPLEKDERWVGMRKRFLYRNPNPNSIEHEKWILHEFSIRKDGRGDEEKEVVCMIRNNGSPSANAIVEAARRSALAGKKRKFDGYIQYFPRRSIDDDASTSSKRARSYYHNPAPQQEQTALPCAVAECSNPLAPLAIQEGEDAIKLEVVFASIDEIDIDCIDQYIDWVDEGGCTDTDPQSVMEFPQASTDTTTTTTTTNTEIWQQEETSEPLYLLPEPASANIPVVEDDGRVKEETMVAAAEDGAQVVSAAVEGGGGGGEGKEMSMVKAEDEHGRGQAVEPEGKEERIVLPWEGTTASTGDCCDFEFGSLNQAEMLQGFSELLDTPLSFGLPLGGEYVQNVEGSNPSWEFEANSDVGLWDYGPW